MPNSLTIEPVSSRAQVEAFIRFPFKLYAKDPVWVPPLLTERRDFLDPRKNPVFEYAKIQPLLARRNGEVVGTIAAIRNDRFGQFHADEANVGFFGLYEAEDDPDVAKALFEAAGEWLRAEGKSVMRGPTNFTTNDVLGLLVEGFDDPPALMMPYNPPYYAAQFEANGLAKSIDLFAFEVTGPQCAGTLDAVVEKILARGRVKIRQVNMSKLKDELEFVRRCYNDAWKDNWGFVPWTDAELAYLVKEIRPVIDPRVSFVGEVDGEPAGISISVPDANQALKLANGKLFPFGLAKLLWKLKVSGCSRLRTIALGIRPEHRRLGLDAVFIQRTIANGVPLGYGVGEMGWILETNDAMIRPLMRINARRSKVYRIYDRAL